MDEARPAAPIDEAAVRQGLAELNELSKLEYREPLDEVLSEPDVEYSAQRVGRLIGVVLKEPFSEVHTLEEPSFKSKAFRRWELVDEHRFDSVLTSTWQHPVLETMRLDLATSERSNAPYFATLSTYDFAREAHHELGFFGAFAESVRKYICGDKEIRKKVADALSSAGRGGSKLPPITPEGIVRAGGLALGAYLVTVIPILGLAGAPVVAAIVVILYTLGVNAFCKWSQRAAYSLFEQG